MLQSELASGMAFSAANRHSSSGEFHTLSLFHRSMTHPPVLSVSQLTEILKGAIETAFPDVWVVGEVSNCIHAGSGHVYFTLKDDEAQLRAVMWRSTASRLRFQLRDGIEVVACGKVELYEARGQLQIVVTQLVPQGVGALELAFRQLHERLAAEGLFDPERKRPLPSFPRRIALITSRDGAAVRDMIQVITRRWQGADLVVVPVPVQGEGAAALIAAALRNVHRIPEVDVVIAGRGGGSLEDLWAFNEEVVARAIAACRVPVISAVGHEIDVTIADLVADRRALTPSEAGELVVPSRDEVAHLLRRTRDRMTAALLDRASRARMRLEALSSRPVLVRPSARIQELGQRLDDLSARMERGLRVRVERAQQQLAATSGKLHVLSPLHVLERGYSITRRLSNGEVLRRAEEVSPGEEILTTLGAGTLRSRVLPASS